MVVTQQKASNIYDKDKNKTDKGIEKISHIIDNMMIPFDNDNTMMVHKTKKKGNDKYDQLMKHIEELERKVEYLMFKINTITK